MICAVAVTVLAVTAMAGEAVFPEGFQKALKLYNKRKYTEAAELFGKLAANPPKRTNARAKCLVYQARCLERMKQYEQAMKLTEKIKSAPYKVMVQMELMLANRKRKALIAKFKDTDFSDYPEEIIDLVYFTRGRAYLLERKPAEAVKDFEKAALDLGDDRRLQAGVYDNLADAYMKLKEYEKAMTAAATAQKKHPHKGFYAFTRNAIRLAQIFSKQGKYSEAKAELDKAWSDKISVTWRTSLMMAYAELALSQKNTGEAKKKYEAALKIAPVRIKKQIKKKLENIK